MFKDMGKKPVKGFIISQNLLVNRGVEEVETEMSGHSS